MSTQSRRKNTSVIENLIESPALFSFFQSVRLLERNAGNKNQAKQGAIAKFSPPAKEIMRFKSRQTLQFPNSELMSVHFQDNEEGEKIQKWELLVNFMGLTGASSILPYHYTEMLLQRSKVKDPSLQNFLDLFNHRSISLFYQASVKYRLPVEYERSKLNIAATNEIDNISQVLKSLIGLGTSSLSNRQYTKDESLLFYAGLLNQKIRTATGLKQILQHHFCIPVEIEEFIGQQQILIRDVRTKLASKDIPQGQNVCLGRNVMLGKKGMLHQGKVRIVLKPSNKQELNKFAPGTKAMKAMGELAKFYLGMEHDYDFMIKIRRIEVPKKIKLQSKKTTLGWNAWLSSKNKTQYNINENLSIKLSSKNLQ